MYPSERFYLLHLSCIKITALANMSSFFMWVLGASLLCGKHFIDLAIFPATDILFFSTGSQYEAHADFNLAIFFLTNLSNVDITGTGGHTLFLSVVLRP